MCIRDRARTIPGKYKEITGLEQLDKVIAIDQSPIGRTPRSNPATYTGVFDQIRDLFASTADAKSKGYKKGRFSFNVDVYKRQPRKMPGNASTLLTWFGKSLRPVDTTAAPAAFASSGKISGVGFAHAKMIASFAIVATISLVRTPGADTPTNT